CRASAAKASPCTRVPGTAKNASPGAIARLSALTPVTASAGTPASPSSSASANDTGAGLTQFHRDDVPVQHRAEIGADAQHRRHALHDAPGRLARVPARRMARLRVLV